MANEQQVATRRTRRGRTRIPGRLDAIARGRDWIVRQARGSGLSDEAIDRMELAATEALTNIVEHGYGGGADLPIELTWRGGQGAVSLTLRDWSDGFDAPAGDEDGAAESDEAAPAESGYGLLLIQRLLDEARYERVDARRDTGDTATDETADAARGMRLVLTLRLDRGPLSLASEANDYGDTASLG